MRGSVAQVQPQWSLCDNPIIFVGRGFTVCGKTRKVVIPNPGNGRGKLREGSAVAENKADSSPRQKPPRFGMTVSDFFRKLFSRGSAGLAVATQTRQSAALERPARNKSPGRPSA